MVIDGGKCRCGADFGELCRPLSVSHINLYKQIYEIKLDWQIIISMATCD